MPHNSEQIPALPNHESAVLCSGYVCPLRQPSVLQFPSCFGPELTVSWVAISDSPSASCNWYQTSGL
ncbi:hypothetical protein COCSUDRAFT_34039 [Coccomyxa subellipsoidea C-169]|uniref:Uncharacterized protein n=1 Tax=Coccomyxa subellipsoidea (strain C-169) TaxID=574566 RepID=I0YNX9_COCSC|nr:hypothetical protein COCSUDRAFT_34039 [Coccomyxa subellipsoidea C-169]EIE20098.1 hypothetical protein COCSUDRAFT_34039 [Coccomyxa subellipsoidea C-169]|eukprot:XP_005644642.1 hypothetical protein COCSUDRAFT_34039 [Coccomyxa subellipsoidea C-169]